MVRPSERAIREELRREAAEVPIPIDLWQNINRQLDKGAVKARRRLDWTAHMARWKPLLGLTAAMGIFLWAVMPPHPTDDVVQHRDTGVIVTEANRQPDVLKVRPPRSVSRESMENSGGDERDYLTNTGSVWVTSR